MDEEDFLLLDDDEESESSVSENKNTPKKPINFESKDIISNISKTVGDKFFRIKESNELKNILDDGKENLISFWLYIQKDFKFPRHIIRQLNNNVDGIPLCLG